MSLNEQLAMSELGRFDTESPALVFGQVYQVLERMRPLTTEVPLTLDFIELLISIDVLVRRGTLTKFHIPDDLLDYGLVEFGDWVYEMGSILAEHHKDFGAKWNTHLIDYLTSKEYPRLYIGLNNHDIRFNGGAITITKDNSWETINQFQNSIFDIRIKKLTRKERKRIRRAIRHRQSENG